MLVSAVGKPVYARVSDMTSRPTALASGLVFYTIGYIVVASAQSVQDLAGGEVLYTIGNTGMSFGLSFLSSLVRLKLTTASQILDRG